MGDMGMGKGGVDCRKEVCVPLALQDDDLGSRGRDLGTSSL